MATKKLLISRDVHFFEKKFPFHSTQLDSDLDPFGDLVFPKFIPEPLINTNISLVTIPQTIHEPEIHPTSIPGLVTKPKTVLGLVSSHNTTCTSSQTPNIRFTQTHPPATYLKDYVQQVSYPMLGHIS